jgi:methyl-accepting chemotaxis protein WspA
VILSTLISRRIISPIKKAASFASTLSKGDFTARMLVSHNNDELGELSSELSHMANNLNSLIGQIQRSGIQVSSSATELSATAKEQEVTIAHQVESVTRVVQTVKEISEVAMHLVEMMQQVASRSEETAELANSGQTDLTHMEEAMHRMEVASKSISGRLGAISEKAENITTVVTTINKVAEQTNLLSLNASIEAEKAGEYGRGFTVVAREIRRLADQTAVATLDIGQMVQEMQSAVSSGIMEMDKFIAEVRHSAEDVGKISTQMCRIIEQVQALTPSFEHVNVDMEQQSKNAQKINNDMKLLSEEMEQTKITLHETYSAIGQLNEAANNLQQEVSRFKVN